MRSLLLLTNKMCCQIKHTGTVVAVESHVVTVRVEQRAACAGCASKDACTLSTEKKDMLLTIKHPQPTLFAVGETVQLVSTQKKLYAAVIVAYILPLVGMLAVVVGCVYGLNNEIMAALCGLVFCGIYALLLMLLPKKYTQKLQIDIEKI